MTARTTNVAYLAAGLVLGVVAILAWQALSEVPDHHGSAETTAVDEPLYWVAPMDPSYRRDGPG